MDAKIRLLQFAVAATCGLQLYRLPDLSILLSMGASGLGKCANPDCHAEFKRLGTGKIYTLPVTSPQAWGLPPNVKQKVVWLCAHCALTREVEFDKQHCQVLLVQREPSTRQSA